MKKFGSYIHGSEMDCSSDTFSLVSPIDLSDIADVISTPDETVERAVDDAADAFQQAQKFSSADRILWLTEAADMIDSRSDELVNLIVYDIGKPRRFAIAEVRRAAQFVRSTAAQIYSFGGECLPLDAHKAGADHIGITRRAPYGVVGAITPFNAPINLLIQKVAPALAVGNSVVAKPHPAGTRVALEVASLFVDSGLPPGLFNVVTGNREPAVALASANRTAVVTFTGGTKAGEALIRAAGARKFVAELGSSAANVVLRDANIDDAAKRIAMASFSASGQQCISAQRVIVEAKIYDKFLNSLVKEANTLKVGDPEDPETDIGPMVSLQHADRVMKMASEAIQSGARYALEPHQEKCVVGPGVLVDTPHTSSVWRDEIFGPLVVVDKVTDINEALWAANDSPFGLQGAIFTRSIANALRFADEFHVGSLWVNEASRFRLDTYPFGGVKQSGFGREGIRYAMEELSQTKFIGIRPVN